MNPKPNKFLNRLTATALLIAAFFCSVLFGCKNPKRNVYNEADYILVKTDTFNNRPGEEIYIYKYDTSRKMFIYYWGDGKLMSKSFSYKNKIDGTMTSYDSKGKLLAIYTYVEGKRIASQEFFTPDTTIQIFKDGRLQPYREDSASLKFIDNMFDSAIQDRSTPSTLNLRHLKTDDLIKQYPDGKKAELRQHLEWLRKEWQNVPSPITATYQGNDFGDYHHIIFKDANGVTYDFGQAKNNYGQYQLHKFSGQYEDNPEFLRKKFKVYWDWKLADFFCCDGEYGKAKAYLPTVTKLELIKN